MTSLRKINQKNLREDLTTGLHQYEALKFIKNCRILENKQLIRKIGLCNNVFLTYLFDIQQFKDIHVRSVLRLSIRTFLSLVCCIFILTLALQTKKETVLGCDWETFSSNTHSIRVVWGLLLPVSTDCQLFTSTLVFLML